jgi:hypothetical protein
METTSFDKKTYLMEVLNELNMNCTNKDISVEYGNYNCNHFEWEIDDLDMDISKCRTYCYIKNEFSSYEAKFLCKSCKTIIKEKIGIFNRKIEEIQIEIYNINKKLDSILTKLNGLDLN